MRSIDKKLQAEHPNEPWKWREDWAAGHIPSGTNRSAIGAWVIALFWNSISTPGLMFIASVWKQNRAAAAVFLIFPLIGISLLYRAIRLTIAGRKFGPSDLVMAGTPGVIGGKLRGSIQAGFDPISQRSVTLKLTCIHRTDSGSGDDRSVNERILWQEEQTLETGLIQAGPTGCLIPVMFQIPSDAAETNVRNLDNSIQWKLRAHADMAGVDYDAEFDVPVFRTKDSVAGSDPPQPADPPKRPTILVQPTNAGGLEFVFPAARNPGMAAGMTVIFLIFSAALYFLVVYSRSIYIGFLFGVACAVLLFVVIMFWFLRQRVTIENGCVTIRSSVLGIARTQQIPCAGISDFKLNIGVQSGGGSGTPYYYIQLICRDGRKRTTGRQIRNKREAVWVMNQMKRAIGTFSTP